MSKSKQTKGRAPSVKETRGVWLHLLHPCDVALLGVALEERVVNDLVRLQLLAPHVLQQAQAPLQVAPVAVAVHEHPVRHLQGGSHLHECRIRRWPGFGEKTVAKVNDKSLKLDGICLQAPPLQKPFMSTP